MTKQSLKRRIDIIEDRRTKQRVVWIWLDDYKEPTRYITRDGDITAAELATLEADPTVKVIVFTWVEGDLDQ